jgi:pimeloyl-ACP methyl ester carboxylesterase
VHRTAPVSAGPASTSGGPDRTLPPFVPPGHVHHLAHRGEIFYRYQRHDDPNAPTLLLLHGWTASADLQFFSAYGPLAEAYSFVAVDHRGHGRGIRNMLEPFRLEDAADDAAELLRALGVGPVVLVGYSMGGPIALHLARRHPDLVNGLVLEATALEWRESRVERLRWRSLSLLGLVLRAWWYPRSVRLGLRRLSRQQPELEPWLPWIEGEVHRNEVRSVVQAGWALAEYDARPWINSIDVPTGLLLTTHDHLVKPAKQRALAQALRADVVEVPGDHLSPWVEPVAFGRVTRQLVDSVVRRIAGSTPSGRPQVTPRRAAG